MRRSKLSPLGALARGLIAGAIGAGAQSLFFKLSRRITPKTPTNVFIPPEKAQKNELATETLARRFVEGFAARGPLSLEDKKRAGDIVHFAFGAGWGGLYALICESHSSLRSPIGAAAFATFVWAVGDNVMLPLFRLSAWPQAYPPKVHLYAWTAHMPYGAGLLGSYEALRLLRWPIIAAALSSLWPFSRTRSLLGTHRRPFRERVEEFLPAYH